MYNIYLSPSNQTANSGVLNYNEAYSMHDLADKVSIHLKRSNMFNVKISDIKMSLTEVCNDSNNWGANLHLCMHSDAFNPNDQGSTAFIFSKGGQAEQYANIIYPKIAALSPGKDRGIIVRPELCELRATKAPSVLVEGFFHTNIVETSFYQKHIADFALAYAKGIYEAFNVKWVDEKLYNDYDSIAEYAKLAVTHLTNIKILTGDNNNNFNPKQPITREELALVLDRAISLFSK